MSFLLEGDYNFGLPTVGELKTGVVVKNQGNTVMIDIGAKSEALIDPSELSRLDETALAQLQEGNEVSVYITNIENQNGDIVVSYAKAIEEKDWERARELLDSQELLECEIVAYNKGGLLTRLGQVRGFVPTSQLARARNHRGANNEEFLRPYVGTTIFTKVIEVDRSRNRLILSERAAQKEIRALRRGELMESLQEGEVIEGRVVNIADFGAFVDIGGMEGLVHISELTWKHQTDPSAIVQVGDVVKAYVLNVDQKRQRVALSLKRLQPDPWSFITERYSEGQLVEVFITKLTDYGAFARLVDNEYDFEGLIHISELSQDHIQHPSQIVKKGQHVTARIIRIAPERKQIGLSLKQVTSMDYLESDLARAEAMAAEEEE